MPRRDDALLIDMVFACRKILDFTSDLDEDSFASNIMAQSAVIREFQVLGEAARMMSDEGKSEHDNLPWNEIAGMRNKLIHEYFDIRLPVVWQTIQNDIPPLLEALEMIANDTGDMDVDK